MKCRNSWFIFGVSFFLLILFTQILEKFGLYRTAFSTIMSIKEEYYSTTKVVEGESDELGMPSSALWNELKELEKKK